MAKRAGQQENRAAVNIDSSQEAERDNDDTQLTFSFTFSFSLLFMHGSFFHS